jgi:nucleoside phosphorylase
MSIPASLLVCFAVEEEARAFRARASGLAHVRVLITGIGQENAKRAMTAALASSPPPATVVTSGFAGGLDPALETGTVLFEADSGFPLLSALRASGARSAVFHCAAAIVTSASQKRWLGHQTGAAAVEMESALIRAACHTRGIPSATVRVISDAADEDLPLDFNLLMTPDQRMSYARLAWALAKSPGKIAELLAFQQRVKRAAEKLADVLVRIANPT